MNREDIICMAQEAGIDIDAWEPLYEGDSAGFRVCECTHEELERFAALVASAEREACAKLCEEMRAYVGRNNAVTQSSAQDCATAIRARGQA